MDRNLQITASREHEEDKKEGEGDVEKANEVG